MAKKTHSAFTHAVVEKDVENAYRQEISRVRPGVQWRSIHNTDGVAEWPVQITTVRMLLEAKFDLQLQQRLPACTVLGQVLLYLKRFERSGERLPDVIMVGDKNECFVLATSAISKFLDLPINWDVPPSQGSPELLRALVSGINILPFVYEVDDRFSFTALVEKIEVLASGVQASVRASTQNLTAIYAHWRDRVYRHGKQSLTPVQEVDIFLRCLFAPEDVYLHPTKKGLLILPAYPAGILVDSEQYRSFFAHFQQGYKPSEVAAFMAMRDRLIEDDARRRQGAFFTPSLWAAEAHREIERVLGPTWKQDCVVWDPAAGTANLTRDYAFASLFSSTLEPSDVNAMQEHGWGGTAFQFDFLNDDIPADVAAHMRAAAAAGKRLVWLMNPPYGTAGAGAGMGSNKEGAARTSINENMKADKIGAASQQLYAQFMFRCTKLASEFGFKDWTIAMFSKPTFVSSGSYKPLRDWWYSQYAYEGGFMFQASQFADVSGAWGVSFTVWNSQGKTDSSVDLTVRICEMENFDVKTKAIKRLYNSDGREASEWVRTPIKGLRGVHAPHMSSGLCVRSVKSPILILPGHVCYMASNSNNLMKSNQGVALMSASYTDGHGFSVVHSNWRRAVALYAARKLVTGNWVNDKDEYLVPDEAAPGYDQWVNDCHVFSLIDSANNCTAMRNVDYKSKTWQIHNHWFWMTHASAMEALDSRDTHATYKDARTHRNEPYFAKLLAEGMALSPDAAQVLAELQKLWSMSLPLRESFYAGRAVTEDEPDLHLTAWDAGIYQLKHLWTAYYPTEWAEVKRLHKELAKRLRAGVFSYGFLRE